MTTLPKRYLKQLIEADLDKKMVFLGGPRQVGKTTLAQSLINNYQDEHPAYLNWDSDLDRRKIRNREWPKSERLIVLDEIHKFKGWRNFVKGLYDTLKNTHTFLITGSARLDHFRKGGDSLLGRYYYYRLHPFSLPELGPNKKNLMRLFKFGGFPEPLLEEDERTLKRWHTGRLSKLVRSDLRDLETVKDLDKVEVLAEELPRRIGSPLSIKSVSEDLEVDPKTAKRWISILDSLYYCFQIAPYGSPRIRAVKKEQKLYLWDWSQVEDPGERFENMVASQLLKYCHFHADANGEKMELRYIRDTDKREVDFVVLKNKEPLFAVECKLKGRSVSPHIFYFKERTSIKKFYQVSLEGEERQVQDGIISTSFERFCAIEDMI
ncbi:MAG: ATP-binding protein [Epsilonproteobacteria bacterium]|nr:MAG: ATP-binding protein [Campylobacterota bacterium]RLA66005.1 MAG: ATP-binding protein [Campylobacterota bacterium]